MRTTFSQTVEYIKSELVFIFSCFHVYFQTMRKQYQYEVYLPGIILSTALTQNLSLINLCLKEVTLIFLAPTLFQRGGALDLVISLTYSLTEKFAPAIYINYIVYLPDGPR